jgi:hypothetical protein
MDRLQWVLIAVVAAIIALAVVALFRGWIPPGH